MLCPHCKTPVPTARRPAREAALCPQCGVLLAPAGLARRLLAKITELARFGLADRADPILRPSDPSAGDA